MRLPGVGPYTADLGTHRGRAAPGRPVPGRVHPRSAPSVPFGGDRVPDHRFREFAETRWGPYQGFAGLYLTTNTEAWAKNLGLRFRLRSGALSDPDRPCCAIASVRRPGCVFCCHK